MNQLLGEYPEIYYSGFVSDAQKELAEAALTLALVRGDSLPTPASVGMGEAPYPNGWVGELRRYLLDVLSGGDVERCERYLSAMDDIYTTISIQCWSRWTTRTRLPVACAGRPTSRGAFSKRPGLTLRLQRSSTHSNVDSALLIHG
jgi:hypothetical protein